MPDVHNYARTELVAVNAGDYVEVDGKLAMVEGQPVDDDGVEELDVSLYRPDGYRTIAGPDLLDVRRIAVADRSDLEAQDGE